MSDDPSIGVFNTTVPITLTLWPNGGWTADQGGFRKPQRVGAWSSAAEMLKALRIALVPLDTDARK